MHEWAFNAAVLWLAILLAVHIIEAVRDPDVITRVLRLDTAAVLVVAILLVVTLYTSEPYYLDAALILSLLAFVGTLAAARFLDGTGLFS